MGKPWVSQIPFRVREEELDSLFEYVVDRFRRYLRSISVSEEIGQIRPLGEEDLESPSKGILFKYLL